MADGTADGTISGTVIGVDEAGRGPVLGPLVVAGVLTPDQEVLRGWGIRDSKALTPLRRRELAGRIRETCEVEVIVITALEIDERRRSMTLNEIEVDAFHHAILGILGRYEGVGGGEAGEWKRNGGGGTGDRGWTNDGDPIRPTIILDAADVNEARFGTDIGAKLLTSLGASHSIPRIISKHRADDTYPVVSAASIIAKTHRDAIIEALKDEYGDIGSGYPADPKTKQYLAELFRSGGPIPIFVRRSWETVRRLEREAASTTLDDFF